MHFAWFFFSHDTAGIGWGADHEYVVSVSNVAIHPAWEALGRGVFVLVKDAVDAVGAQVMGKIQDAVGVFW